MNRMNSSKHSKIRTRGYGEFRAHTKTRTVGTKLVHWYRGVGSYHKLETGEEKPQLKIMHQQNGLGKSLQSENSVKGKGQILGIL